MPIWILAAVLAMTFVSPPKVIHLEAEDAARTGVTISTSRAGYSGTGYVTGFQRDGDRIIFHISNATAGLYDIRIRYSSPMGDKGYDLTVDGAKFSGMFARTGDLFATHEAGKVELQAGENTLTIEKGWGYFDIDAVDLVPSAPPRRLRPPSVTPVDPSATPHARALMSYLAHLYGAKTLSGQYDQSESEYIRAVTGKKPALLGGDLMDYSPSRVRFGGMPQGLSEKMIDSARAGQILTLSWHWNAPTDLLDKSYVDKQGQTVDARWYKGFYTYATTFDVKRALDTPGSEDYRLILSDIDAIAAQLQKFADADIPVLWRPLHEAEGGWFWWGAKGPAPFVQLWRLMYARLSGYHNLHNLIWVYTGSANMAWYPGDAYVDIVGIDAYPGDPGDPLSGAWEEMQSRFDGKKLLALTEFGGVPDVEKMRRYGVRWSYFVSWTGGLGPHKMSKDVLSGIYHGDAVVNQDALGPLLQAYGQ